MHRLLKSLTARLGLIALLLSACEWRGNSRHEELADVAQKFFVVASRGDMNALEKLTSATQPMQFVQHFKLKEPALLSAGARGLSIHTVVPVSDGKTVVARLTFPYAGKTEAVSIQFSHFRTGWKVAHIDLPDRF
jgi:hypothetical protein